MADNKKGGEKLPVDAKESFLKSVEKKSKKADEKSPSAEIVESDVKDSAPVLFDKDEKTEQKNDNENKYNKSVKENKKQTNKKHEVESKLKYRKLPFINIIPVMMMFQSLFLLVIPFLSSSGAVTYVIVTLFWLSIISSGGLLLFVKLKYKDVIDSLYSEISTTRKVYRFFSVINFFRNKKAKIADIAFFVATFVLILLIILGTENIFDNIALTAIVMSLFMLSLNLHVYFNDSIYEYSIKYNKFIQEKDVIANE